MHLLSQIPHSQSKPAANALAPRRKSSITLGGSQPNRLQTQKAQATSEQWLVRKAASLKIWQWMPLSLHWFSPWLKTPQSSFQTETHAKAAKIRETLKPHWLNSTLEALSASLISKASLSRTGNRAQKALPAAELSRSSSQTASKPAAAKAQTGTVSIRATRPTASMEALLKIFDIPYKFHLGSYQGWTETLTPQEFSEAAQSAKSLALGDLHGSYVKLVETLVAGHFIKMSKAAACKFALLTTHPANFSQDSRQVNRLYQELKALVPSMQWTGGKRQLILIGDVLADRGPFDNITLDIVEHLTEGHPERIIRMASNHDHDALTYLTYGVGNIMPQQANSLYKAFELALRNRTTDALRQQYQRYLEQSKLMYYNPETETLYTHAPVSQINLRLLIAYMKQAGIKNVPAYADLNRENLPSFTEMANRFYQQAVRESVRRGVLNPYIKQLVNGDSGFLWSRDPLQNRADLPLVDQGVRQLVHGHDDGTHHSPFAEIRKDGSYGIFNLDQSVRKQGANYGESNLYAEY